MGETPQIDMTRIVSNNQEFLEAIDDQLRHAFGQGYPFTTEPKLPPRMRIDSLDPLEMTWYKAGKLHGIFLPKLPDEVDVEALVLRDEDRDILRNYAVLNDEGSRYGITAGPSMLAAMALRFDVMYELAPEPPAIEPDELSRRYALQGRH